MPSIHKQRLPQVDNPELFDFLKSFKEMFTEDRWIPQTANITHTTSVEGAFQRMGRVVFVVARFNSDGALAVAANATVLLPVPPYKRNSVYQFAAHNFTFSDVSGTGNIQDCWMDATSGLVKPKAAIAATASHLVFSGWYYTE